MGGIQVKETETKPYAVKAGGSQWARERSCKDVMYLCSHYD